MRVITLDRLPLDPDPDCHYVLGAGSVHHSYYNDRTDRNIGWISAEEQQLLKNKAVGIAGCGGMGGVVAQILLRAGIGTLKLTDVEAFDTSNINRQFGATRGNIGQHKVFATANELQNITDDAILHAYPHGVNESDIDDFLSGCDLVIDAIEFWAVAPRILLHQRARALGIPILNGGTTGFSTCLYLFTPDSTPLESCMNMSYEEAKLLGNKINANTANEAERNRIIMAVATAFIPHIPRYCPPSEPCGHPAAILERLKNEGKGAVIASNPFMAGGLLATHSILYLLKDSGVRRYTVTLPTAPGYLYLDGALMKCHVRKDSWWLRLQMRMKAVALSFIVRRKSAS